MTRVATYKQARYARGVCFRLSFKWAALSLVGGEFNMALDNAGLNVASTVGKHVAYRQVSQAKETDPSANFTDKAEFDSYVAEDGKQAADYINKWGLRFKGSKGSGGQVYNGVTVAANLSQKLSQYFATESYAADRSLVYGYYGLKASKPAGHAVAFSKGRFFDSNTGVWDCAPPGGAGVDIDNYIATHYPWPTKFVIFVLTSKPSNGVVASGKGCVLL